MAPYPSVLSTPLPGVRFRRRRRLFERRRRFDWLMLIVAVMALWMAWSTIGWIRDWYEVDVELAGLPGEFIDAAEADSLALEIGIGRGEDSEMATIQIDGEDVTEEAERNGNRFRWQSQPELLTEGEHSIKLTVPRFLFGDATKTWRFTVDHTAPKVRLPTVLDPVVMGEPVKVEGKVEPDARLTVEGREVDLDDGRFELAFDSAPPGPLEVVAVDPAGNRTVQELIVPVRYPGARGVHMSAASWNYDPMREGVLSLIEQGRIDTVQIDIKDEGGIVGHRSSVALANEAGAAKNMYELRDVVKELQDRGVRVVGRVVVFRDPLLASLAKERGESDMVLQSPDGSPHPAYGGFTNIASEEVWDYNIDLALEAVDAGIDDILYDYIRRPEGSLDSMRIPGLQGRPHDAVGGFLEKSHRLLRERGAFQGASVFGIAASRPDPVAQDIGLIARHSDYVSPMVYPALWVKGEYRVPDPVRMPFEIVQKSLADFQEQMADTGKPLVPWLQDFSLGYTYGPAEVQAQIDAARSLGIDSFLMWDPLVSYTTEGLRPLR